MESMMGVSLNLAGGAEYIQPSATNAVVVRTGAYVCSMPLGNEPIGLKVDGSIEAATVIIEAVIAARYTKS
jgi:hypothetical protein